MPKRTSIRFRFGKLRPMIASMQAIIEDIMKLIDAIRRRLSGGEPARDALRRDIGLVEKPDPHRRWQDYL